MLCLTSTTNTRVLQWSPDIVVRVANSDVVPVDALVETIVHFPVSGRKAVLRRGLVSSQFRKVLLSGPALAEVGIETRTARGPKFGGFLEWADGGLEPFQRAHRTRWSSSSHKVHSAWSLGHGGGFGGNGAQ